jgi:hypothetical protein
MIQHRKAEITVEIPAFVRDFIESFANAKGNPALVSAGELVWARTAIEVAMDRAEGFLDGVEEIEAYAGALFLGEFHDHLKNISNPDPDKVAAKKDVVASRLSALADADPAPY